MKLVVKGASAQTQDLFQLQDSTGAALQRTDASGNLEMIGYINNGSGGIGQYSNLLTYSEQFDNSAWAKSNVTVTANDSASNPAPDSQTTADKLVSSSTNATVQQTYTTSTNGTYTFSVWLKANSSTQGVQLRLDSTGATPTTGTAKSFTATTTWQRFSVSQTFTGTPSNIKPTIIITNNTATVVAWGGQLVVGSSPQVYVRTSASSTAAANGIVSNGNGLFQNATDSNAAFQIQRASGDTMFVADTTNNKVTIGNSTGTDANTTLLVFDSATADPATG
jgi:hypothetical protein